MSTPLLHLADVPNNDEVKTPLVNGALGGMAITLRNSTQKKSTTNSKLVLITCIIHVRTCIIGKASTDRLLHRRHTSPSLLIRPQSHRFIYSSSYPYMMNSTSSGDFKQASETKDLTRSIRLPSVPLSNRHPVQHTLFRAIKKHSTTSNSRHDSLNLLNKFTIIGRKVMSPDLYANDSPSARGKDDQLLFKNSKSKFEQLKTTPVRRMKKSPSHNSKGKQKKVSK